MSLRGKSTAKADGTRNREMYTNGVSRDHSMKGISVGSYPQGEVTTGTTVALKSGMVDDAHDIAHRLENIVSLLGSAIADLTGTPASAGQGINAPERADRTVECGIYNARMTLNTIESQLVYLGWILNGDKVVDAAVGKAGR